MTRTIYNTRQTVWATPTGELCNVGGNHCDHRVCFEVRLPTGLDWLSSGARRRVEVQLLNPDRPVARWRGEGLEAA